MSELLSMNLLMAGMFPTVMILRRYVPDAGNPLTPNFWFVMSMGLLVGFIVAYPMNWWLVANRLKHGMMTVRPAAAAGHDHEAMSGQMSGQTSGVSHEAHMAMADGKPLSPPLWVMALLSFAALAAGVAIAMAMMSRP